MTPKDGVVTAPASKPAVLIVDDDKLILRMLSDAVEEAGCEALVAESSAEAVALLPRNPLMAFVDVHLPGDQGDEFCRLVRLDPKHWGLPVVMITSSDKVEVIRRCLISGADDFAPKPVDKRQLLTKVACVREGLGFAGPKPILQRVLLATEHTFFRTVVGRLLEHSGITVTYASTIEAVAAAIHSPASAKVGVVDLELAKDAPAATRLREIFAQHSVPMIGVASRSYIQAHRPQWAGTAPWAWASLQPYDIDEERDELVRHLHRTLSTQMQGSDRRRKPRVSLFATIFFRPAGTSAWLAGYGFDISESGLFVRTLSPLPPGGGTIELSFKLADDSKPMEAKGMVVWTHRCGERHIATVPFGMGITFTDFAAVEWAQLRDYVTARLNDDRQAPPRA